MKGRDRNGPCWCGSRRKYKKCHLDRERQENDNPWAAVAINRKAFHQKKCWASDVGLGPCDGKIIKAHTVSRGPNLSKIARDGRVMHYTINIPTMIENGGRLSVEEIGIGNASVFHGFCAGHDRTLFSCIENEPFIGRPDQCLAVAYRTLSREVYGKDAASHLRETLRGADKGLSLAQQRQFQNLLDQMDIGNEAARKELKSTHDILTRALVDGRPEVLRSLVIEFAGGLPFMFAGAWSPFTDFYGGKLQDGYEDELLNQIFMSSFVGVKHGYVCISWVDVDGAPGQVIADQIQNLPANKQAEACLLIVAKHIENIFYDPHWFTALGTDQRELLDVLVADGLDTLGSPPSAPIRLEVGFDLPAVAHSRIID